MLLGVGIEGMLIPHADALSHTVAKITAAFKSLKHVMARHARVGGPAGSG